ncbi:MAG TPA: uroporphyrinogen-III C-methyltransferase [Puia sp.]|jgi:uroporphyrin-III C-methyltransferase|nr:uroporphyrinogen-III C-methyltransferase [Puia sp.]
MKRIPNQHKGKVIIAGAGPGDPELLTLKALRYLQKADVVITDRLVSEVILEEYTNKDAQILHVGKQCRKGASTPQSTINELIVDFALRGNLVVRLKGGDVSIFSNVLDELQVLTQYAIEYEIIPGVTAALGAAAYAGIPLTARNYATAVRFLTYYNPDLLENAYWKELGQTADTLVFYMSSGVVDGIVNKLTSNGIGKDIHVAIIEQATTPLQNVYCCNIHEYMKKWKNTDYVSPTLIIIGKVAALHQQFQWSGNSHRKENYFKPLEKNRRISVRA